MRIQASQLRPIGWSELTNYIRLGTLPLGPSSQTILQLRCFPSHCQSENCDGESKEVFPHIDELIHWSRSLQCGLPHLRARLGLMRSKVMPGFVRSRMFIATSCLQDSASSFRSVMR